MGGIFGGGETIISVSSTNIRVSNPSLYRTVKTDSVVKFMKNNWGSSDYLANYAKSGDTQFQVYYNAGEDYVLDRPYMVLRTYAITDEVVKNVIVSLVGNVDNVEYSYISINPEDELYVKYNLQQTINYSYDDDLVTIDNVLYRYKKYVYDEDNNVYIATLTPITKFIIFTYTITDITITSGTTEDTKRTKVSTRTIKQDNVNYVTLSDTTSVVSDTFSTIPHGSEEDSHIEELSNVSTETISNVADKTITISPYTPDTYYLTAIYTKNNKSYLLVKNTNDITNHGLSSQHKISKRLDTFPIVQLRKWNKDITHDQYKNTDWYKTAEYVLHRIGLNVDDIIKTYNENSDMGNIRHVFFLFGVLVNDGHGNNDDDVEGKEIVSKFLWETYEYYDQLVPNVEPLAKLELYVESGDYNASCKWRHIPPTIEEGRIGPVGTYTHSVRKEEYTKVRVTVRHTEYKYPNDEHNSSSYIMWYKAEWKIVTEYKTTRIYHGGEIKYSTDTSGDEPVTTGYWDPGEVFLEIDTTPPRTYEVHDTGRSYYNADSDTYDVSEEYPVGDFVIIDHARRTPIYWHQGLTDFDDRLDGGDYEAEGKSKPSRELVLKKQIDATHVKVHRIWRARNNYTVDSDEDDWGDGKADHFLQEKEFLVHIPLDIINRMSIIDKTKLMGFCMQMTFFAYKKTHLEWYETSSFAATFRGLTFGIAAVVTFASFGTAGPAAFGSWSAAATTIGKGLLIAGATYAALKLISVAVGDVTLKMVLSAAVTIVAAYAGGAFDEFNGMTIASLLEVPATALDVYAKDIQQKTQNLQKQSAEYNELYEERMEEFKELSKSLISDLTTESTVELATESNGMEQFTGEAYCLSPSMFYALGTNAYLNTDLVLDGTFDVVEKFVNNKQF